MNSEAAKNPVLDVRKELEALRDEFRRWGDNGGSWIRHDLFVAADEIDALLQRIPEGWEMRAREPSADAARLGGYLLTHCSFCEQETMIGWASYDVWRAMWDAVKEEFRDER